MNEDNSFIIDKIKIIEQALIGKVSEIEHRNNVFKGFIRILNPIIFSPFSIPHYNEENIGYNYNLNIETDIGIISDREYNILSFKLPCYGVWMIKYRLEINLSLGFTCLKNSRIKLSGSHRDYIDNINNISNINQLLVTSSDTVIVSDEVNLTLKCYFVFGRVISQGIFTIIKNGDFPILNITRIA